MKLPGGIRAPIRPNGVDGNTPADMFDRRLYDLSDVGVRRVLDLGANIRMATLFFAFRFPVAEFASVEPSPENRVVLRKVIRLNRIRATVFEGAVGTDDGEAEPDVGCEPDMFSLTPANATGNKLRIRQFSVSELLAAVGWQDVDLLKIDIEGYEKTLFHNKNSWLRRVRLTVGEAHGHVGYRIKDLQADLLPFGFQVVEKKCDEVYGLTICEARNSSI